MKNVNSKKKLAIFNNFVLITFVSIIIYFFPNNNFAFSEHPQNIQENNSLINNHNLSYEYLSLKSSEVYMRKGPGKQFPKLRLYKAKGAPLKVLLRLDSWIKVADWNGNLGWIHRSLLSTKPSAIVKINMIPVMSTARLDSNLKGYIQLLTLIYIDKCIAEWCKIQHSDISGWVIKSNIWGNIK